MRFDRSPIIGFGCLGFIIEVAEMPFTTVDLDGRPPAASIPVDASVAGAGFRNRWPLWWGSLGSDPGAGEDLVEQLVVKAHWRHSRAIETGILTKEAPGRMVIEQGSRFEVVVVAEVNAATIDTNADVPVAVLRRYPFAAADTPLKPAIPLVLGPVNQTEISPPIIKAIAIDVINDLTGLGVHQVAVHGDGDALAILDLDASGVAMISELPLPLAEEVVVGVIDERDRALGEGNPLRHEGEPFMRGRETGEGFMAETGNVVSLTLIVCEPSQGIKRVLNLLSSWILLKRPTDINPEKSKWRVFT
jgi:hypothetical protein